MINSSWNRYVFFSQNFNLVFQYLKNILRDSEQIEEFRNIFLYLIRTIICYREKYILQSEQASKVVRI